MKLSGFKLLALFLCFMGLVACGGGSSSDSSGDQGDNGIAAACNDGQDNDSDGETDFPNDPGCSNANDDDETDPSTEEPSEFFWPEAPVPQAGSECPTLLNGTNSIDVGGVERQFELRIDNPDGKPVLFLWHWLGGAPEYIINDTGMGGYQSDAIVVAPYSSGTANYEWHYDVAAADNPDLAMFDEIRRCLYEQFDADLNRYWVAGHSAGAMMTTYTIMHRANMVAAAVALSGGIRNSESYSTPHSDIPVLLSWGGDTDIYYEEGTSHEFNNGDPASYSFHEATLTFSSFLQADGHSVVECEGDYGHALPPSGAFDYIVPFLENFQRNTTLIDFATLLEELPEECEIP